ncbi:S9 family peptidase [Shewanella sp. C32]|uniref:S9 family peptidase n=1 Tax=Shewanella electrica TaxID=515560 RepID=A0ABT2FH44_9GAMM|nr:S9 family peptidase [Shewanella electrica]MCH1923559.1 S9 family peptidase [Shewanella electrica]MCS4555655.1 S9 family peptidase [Shewanella electrica]
MKPIHYLSAAIISAIAGLSLNANAADSITAPVAKKVPHELVTNGHKRIDNYYWLRDDTRKDPQMLSYLQAENAYADAEMADTKTLQSQLFDEMKSRIPLHDSSLPIKSGHYYYATEMVGDNEYPIYVRSSTLDGQDKQTILDVNQLAKGHAFFNLSNVEPSPNEKLLAYTVDTVSRNLFIAKIIDLSTGKPLSDELVNIQGDIVWGNDNQTLYYIKKNPTTLLGYQVYRHTLGQTQSADELVYDETDLSYYTYLRKSKDKSTIYIAHQATEATGVHLIDANDPHAKPVAFTARDPQLIYDVQKRGDDFYILTNLGAKNSRIMKVAAKAIGDKARWQEVIPGSDTAQIQAFELFNDYLVYQVRSDAQSHIKVVSLKDGSQREVAFDGEAYSLDLYGNNELDNTVLRLQYSSFTTPTIDYDVDLTTLKLTQLKQQKVLGDFDANNYLSKRIFVKARDGAQVPVTLVYRKDTKIDGTAPLYQYGYGSYGANMDPSFKPELISLLDRGFVYATAHIRGSQMKGRGWYEDGKKLNKKNTFNDFVDVTKSLVAQGYGAKDNVFAVGGSAGGLLMGAVINQAPELYNGVAAHVPFVDVVTTMLDESIPLTTNEYDEWGNPSQPKYYDYMLSYAPYDNVKKQAYPNLLVTTGLFDSQVQYYEPAKWVAKLRDYKTDDHLLLFKTDMESGHGGASGRFNGLHETAFEYAFFLKLLKQK